MTRLGWTRMTVREGRDHNRVVYYHGVSHLVVQDAPEASRRLRCGLHVRGVDLDRLHATPPVDDLTDVCQRCARPWREKETQK